MLLDDNLKKALHRCASNLNFCEESGDNKSDIALNDNYKPEFIRGPKIL